MYTSELVLTLHKDNIFALIIEERTSIHSNQVLKMYTFLILKKNKM